MKPLLVVFSAALLAATVARAQTADPIALREKTMKAVGDIWYGDIGKMNRGQKPFNAKAIDADLKKITDAAKLMPTLFPDTAKTGEKTRALPAIWEHKDDLVARYKKLGVTIASYEGKIATPEQLKAAYPAINSVCSGCHDHYRAKGHDE